MGSRLSTRSEEFLPAENQTWLGTAHGTREAKSITVDGDAAIAIFDDGFVPSGVAVFKNAEDRYEPVTVGNEGDTEGYLFTSTVVRAGELTSAALYWHGRVIVANLPAATGAYVGPVTAVQDALVHIKHD